MLRHPKVEILQLVVLGSELFFKLGVSKIRGFVTFFPDDRTSYVCFVT